MRLVDCAIPGPMIIEPRVHGDERGFFMETWSSARFAEAGLPVDWAQDNHSRSNRGVLRGLHFQNPAPQGKLVRVVSGAIFDVAVDLRRSSSHFGRWVGTELSAANKQMFWVPEGFAHGFLTLQDHTDVLYKCTASYAPDAEQSLAWDDPDIAIDWPLEGRSPVLSDKDRNALSLAQIRAFE